MQLSSPAMQPINTAHFSGKRTRQAAAGLALSTALLTGGATAAGAENGTETPPVLSAEDLSDFGTGEAGTFTMQGDNASLPVQEGTLICEAQTLENLENPNIVHCEQASLPERILLQPKILLGLGVASAFGYAAAKIQPLLGRKEG